MNSVYLCIVNKQKQDKNNNSMRRLQISPALTQMLREMKEGEAVKVLASDCKETALRTVASRLKKTEGLVYKVNAYDKCCIVTRMA